MATYKTQEILNLISDIATDGYPLVNIYEMEADDDFPTSLSFDAIDPDTGFEVDYESIESCSNSEIDSSSRYIATKDDYCGLGFTFDEVAIIHMALKNALLHLKNCVENPECPDADKTKIKTSSIDMRNVQAKIEKFMKRIK